MKEVVIVSAVRTPIGSFGGYYKDFSAIDLGAVAVKAAIDRINLDPHEIDEVILGNVLQAGLGQNPARQVSVKAGISTEVPSFTINKVCGSGLKSVELATQSIIAGDAEVVVAGGTENMSQAPYLLPTARYGSRMGDATLIDSVIKDGLQDAFGQYHMGITAENIAEKYGYTREQQDKFAAESQNKTEAAMKNQRFRDEIVPVEIPQRKKETITVADDEYPRQGVTVESLAKLRPAFKQDGTVTAANASGINDGAAVLILMSKEKSESLKIKPLVKIVAYASAGVPPEIMGTGPVPATRKALKKASLAISDLDLVEANEAFASQAMSVVQDLALDPEIVNVNGGAIALGHPIGASGARILVTLIYEMIKRDANNGLATLCIGGGQGTALIVSR